MVLQTESYPIFIEPGFEKLEEAVSLLRPADRKVCIVTDTHVQPLHLETVRSVFLRLFQSVSVFVFEAGEEQKNLDTVRALYLHLIQNRFERRDLLAALGGGVVGDLTGFGAATYLRGIDFIQIPTTLLAQVDSSIGGKTGVDLDAYKNMVGAFHMPKLVYAAQSTLKTLPVREFLSGMAEVIKHGLILDPDYDRFIREHIEAIRARETDVLVPMVCRSCEIKRDVVTEDPKEQGIRALLNFGHTIGHAIEKLEDFSLLHGECVSLGMMAAADISRTLGLIDSESVQAIRELLIRFDLPVSLDDARCARHQLSAGMILAATKSDKKMSAGSVRFILLDPVGHAVIRHDLSDAQILEGIRAIGAGN